MARTSGGRGLDIAPSRARPAWAEPEPGPEQPPPRRRGPTPLLIALAAILLMVVAGVWALVRHRGQPAPEADPAGRAAPLVRAPPGPWKVRPADPGGLKVEPAESTIFSAGVGEDPGGSIDSEAAPEEPLPRPGALPPAPPATEDSGADARPSPKPGAIQGDTP